MALDRLSAEIADLDMWLPARPNTAPRPVAATLTPQRPSRSAWADDRDDTDDADPERTIRARIPGRQP